MWGGKLKKVICTWLSAWKRKPNNIKTTAAVSLPVRCLLGTNHNWFIRFRRHFSSTGSTIQVCPTANARGLHQPNTAAHVQESTCAPAQGVQCRRKHSATLEQPAGKAHVRQRSSSSGQGEGKGEGGDGQVGRRVSPGRGWSLGATIELHPNSRPQAVQLAQTCNGCIGVQFIWSTFQWQGRPSLDFIFCCILCV